MELGIKPSEASDRLNIFQSQFDELWTKYITYSGGEELFGLPVTQYPDMQRIKRELNLLQKLYQLYNTVLESVNGYYDVPWTDIDIDKINNELLDFQNRSDITFSVSFPSGIKKIKLRLAIDYA